MFQLSVPGEVLLVNNIGNSLMHYMSGMYPLQKMAGGSLVFLLFGMVLNDYRFI